MERTNTNMDEKPIPRVEKVDYSGAHEKTDPKEIALVRKLDRWIMVCFHDPSLCQCMNITGQQY